MTTLTALPASVTPEAATRIAKLGLQTTVDRMIDYALRLLPDLERIEVVLYDRYELGDEPGLAINAYSPRPFHPADKADRDLDRWMVAEFSPETLQHVILSFRQGVPHAG